MDDVSALEPIVFDMGLPAGYERSGMDLLAASSTPAQLPDHVYGPSVSPEVLAENPEALNAELDALKDKGEVLIATPPSGQRFFGRPEIHGVPAPHVQRRLEEVTQSGELTEAIIDQSQYPYTAIGRLSYSIEGVVRYCTAWVVSERVIATAGHCVFSRSVHSNGNGQSSDRDIGSDKLGEASSEKVSGLADWAIFEPAYRAGAETEKWAGVRGYVLKAWIAPEAGEPTSPHDFAFIVLDKPILSKTGALGVRVANPDMPEAAVSLGYPQSPSSAYAFDGRHLYASTGRLKSSALGVLEAENQLTEGSSGGPWLSRTREGIVVTGINSNKPLRSDDTTYSPVLGQSFIALLSRVLSDMTGV
ncbi:trypsin-like serine peptidase [Hirschia litorea]|uniref:Trypsin-like serine peptidase n=1 Tax=Hirschia litorea TaxID=1199156 RepID=A0ABW2IIM8_9PROT